MLLSSRSVKARSCRESKVFVSILMAVLVAVGTTGWAAGEPREPLARVILDSTALSFEPLSEAEGWILTVSGPDGFYQRHELSGTAPRLELAGSGAELLADGQYNWELRRKSPAHPRESQWGHFWLRGGAPLLPDLSATETSPAPQGSPDVTGDFFIDGGSPSAPRSAATRTWALRTSS